MGLRNDLFIYYTCLNLKSTLFSLNRNDDKCVTNRMFFYCGRTTYTRTNISLIYNRYTKDTWIFVLGHLIHVCTVQCTQTYVHILILIGGMKQTVEKPIYLIVSIYLSIYTYVKGENRWMSGTCMTFHMHAKQRKQQLLFDLFYFL